MPLPAFEANGNPTAPLPEFGEETPPSVTGQFRREDIPQIYKRRIRVGLPSDHRVHKLECGGDCRVVTDGSGRRFPSTFGAYWDGNDLVLEAGKERFRAKSKLVRIENWKEGALVAIDGKPYRGVIELAGTANGFRVVNELPVEEYLLGVVPNEIGRLDSTMFEALKAQAVAARTYAYKHFLSRQSQGFDVYADVHDQVYEGFGGEAPLASLAVEESNGVTMQFNKQLIEAYYHSTCGGHTESVEAWNRAPVPYLKAVPDLDPQGNAWCALSSYSQWEVHYTWPELTQVAKQYLQTANPDTVIDFHRIEKVLVLDRLPGMRVANVLFVTDKGTFVVKGDKNRWIFRNPQTPEKTLPSAWFDVVQDSAGLTLKGRGFGHGIGFCQMGARALAKAGFGYKEILWHYYPTVDLVKW